MKSNIFKILKYYISGFFNEKNAKDIIFMGYNALHFNFNSPYLFEYYRTNHPEYNVYFILNDKDDYAKYKKIYGDSIINSIDPKYIKLIFKAGTWITSGGLPFRVPFVNTNRVVVNLGHGMPLKGLGLDNRENTFIQNLGIKIIYSKFDLISATSSLFQTILARSYASTFKQVQVLGNCWSDEVINLKNPTEVLERLYPRLPEFKKAILYAPTWRQNSETKIFPFEDFDLFKFEEYLEKNQFIIFLRLHHLDKHNINRFSNTSRIILMNEDVVSDIMGLLSVFDSLITDYSSIIVDYLLLDRPALLLPYDEKEYISTRTLNVPLKEFQFYKTMNTTKEFEDTLEIALTKNHITEQQKKARDRFFLFKDNKNCERHFYAIKKFIENKHGRFKDS